MIHFDKYFDPFYFLLALFIGILIVYTTVPAPDIIIMYPTPENAGKIVYQDAANNCYKYEANSVDCPNNENEIKDITVQGIEIEKKNTEGIFSMWKKMF
jgi:hypothetical protein